MHLPSSNQPLHSGTGILLGRAERSHELLGARAGGPARPARSHELVDAGARARGPARSERSHEVVGARPIFHVSRGV